MLLDVCASSWKYLDHSPVYTVYSHKEVYFDCSHVLFTQYIYTTNPCIWHPMLQSPTDSLCNKSKETIFVRTLAVSFSATLRRTSGPVVGTNPLSFSAYHTTKTRQSLLTKTCSLVLSLSLFFMHAHT